MCISGTCKPLFTGTQILTLADQQQLNTWAGVAASHVWKQCYGADGSWGTGTALHNACWGKGPAITIIKSGGHVFGAYQYEPWARSTDPWNPLLYGKDPKAFLFSLDQKAKLPVEAPGTYAYWAFYTGDGKAPGPKFGQGDLTIAANLATGTSNLGVTYDTKSLPCLYACGTYFTGEGSFPVHRIEVYWW